MQLRFIFIVITSVFVNFIIEKFGIKIWKFLEFQLGTYFFNIIKDLFHINLTAFFMELITLAHNISKTM